MEYHMYLTLLVLTHPVLAANARGEGSSNGQDLQKISTPNGRYTVISGYSIRYAIRSAMLANGATMWRKHDESDDAQDASGYTYGPDNVPAMKDAIPASPDAFDDTVAFGYMVAEKDKAGRAHKRRGSIQVSPAISTTPYAGDTGFGRGLSAKKDQLQPFTYERHYTRYQYLITANLRDFKSRSEALKHILDTVPSLQVGGSQSANASSLMPEVLVWRFHKTPGQGGLYFAGGLNIPVEGTPDLSALRQRAEDLGFDYDVAGKSVSEKSIADGLASIWQDCQTRIKEAK